ncbi:MAG: prolipoprotein diacylglyceryl transferase [Zetaproteobacteria bacterium]|nr:MAG: prolipoprotein diacylglyceryl transferase [Zetaproteobacteria bacterium]
MDFSYFQFDPVAFSLGPFVVRWYALAYMVGFMAGWKYCLRLASRGAETVRPNPDDVDDFLTWAVIGVLVGGRLGYVFFYQPAFYASEPMEAFKIWKGGMSFHGGLLGVAVAMLTFSKVRKISVWRLSDIICAAAPIGLFFGRMANFVNAELYGKVTTLPWGIRFPGTTEPRHPSQVYEAILEGFVLFFILFFLIRSPKIKTGVVTGVFLLGYGVFRALVEFVREPDVQIGLVGGFISMGQILCLPMIFGGATVVHFAMQGKLSNAKKHVE